MPYLTPDAPTENVLFRATVANSLMPSFVGALASLWNPLHWEQFGALTIPQTLEYVGEAIASIQEGPLPPMTTDYVGVRLSGGGETLVSGNYDNLPYNTIVHDTDAFYGDPPETAVAIPVGLAGYYDIRVMATVYTNGSAGYLELDTTLQGVAVLRQSMNLLYAGVTNYTDFNSNVVAYLDEGDVIYVTAHQTTGNDLLIYLNELTLNRLGS